MIHRKRFRCKYYFAPSVNRSPLPMEGGRAKQAVRTLRCLGALPHFLDKVQQLFALVHV